ncbi:MAG: GtrA family protein [Aggregatilineales bacterium]
MTRAESIREAIRHNPLDTLVHSVAGRFGRRAPEVERFLKFAIIGALGAVLDVTMLFALQATILPPVTTLAVVAATSAAFLTATVHNYLWNRYWTFPDARGHSLRWQLIRFTIINAIGWLLRTVWISAAYLWLGALLMPVALPVVRLFRPAYVPSATASAKLGSIAALLIGIAVILFWNFLANRLWTFREAGRASA